MYLRHQRYDPTLALDKSWHESHIFDCQGGQENGVVYPVETGASR